jgi:iron-sulfur cluster assembly protein
MRPARGREERRLRGVGIHLRIRRRKGPIDEVVEDKGVTILIDPKAVLFLIGTTIDYETTKLSSKFVFNNPNETDACGCGESVTIQPAPEALD